MHPARITGLDVDLPAAHSYSLDAFQAHHSFSGEGCHTHVLQPASASLRPTSPANSTPEEELLHPHANMAAVQCVSRPARWMP
jgi:hypothetical protein